MKKLKGTEKQIKWAKDIMNNAIHNLQINIDRWENSDNRDFYKYYIQAYKECKKSLEDCFDKAEYAKQIIDNRDQFTTEKVFAQANFREEQLRTGK